MKNSAKFWVLMFYTSMTVLIYFLYPYPLFWCIFLASYSSFCTQPHVYVNYDWGGDVIAAVEDSPYITLIISVLLWWFVAKFNKWLDSV